VLPQVYSLLMRKASYESPALMPETVNEQSSITTTNEG
jgi:hypothetical protein